MASGGRRGAYLGELGAEDDRADERVNVLCVRDHAPGLRVDNSFRTRAVLRPPPTQIIAFVLGRFLRQIPLLPPPPRGGRTTAAGASISSSMRYLPVDWEICSVTMSSSTPRNASGD
jgi:hypothetical protein